MQIPTASLDHNIDHIAISNSYIPNEIIEPKSWNENPKISIPALSDHMGVYVKIIG